MQNKLTCYIQAIEICTPGIMNWQTAKEILTCKQDYQITEDTPPGADILPAREKRRASPTVSLSLHIAEKLQHQAKIDADLLRTVFASSDGDMDIFHYLADTLSQPQPAISPMLFHQSLHNSAAGNWNIAVKSQQSSISISAGNDTFCGGLLTAMIDTCTTNMPVLFVAYNVTSPAPLNAVNPMLTWFGAGFILTHKKTEHSIAKMSYSLVNQQDETTLSSASLNQLRIGNPIARCLPFLQLIATQCHQPLYLNYLDKNSLKIELEEYYL